MKVKFRVEHEEGNREMWADVTVDTKKKTADVRLTAYTDCFSFYEVGNEYNFANVIGDKVQKYALLLFKAGFDDISGQLEYADYDDDYWYDEYEYTVPAVTVLSAESYRKLRSSRGSGKVKALARKKVGGKTVVLTYTVRKVRKGASYPPKEFSFRITAKAKGVDVRKLRKVLAEIGFPEKELSKEFDKVLKLIKNKTVVEFTNEGIWVKNPNENSPKYGDFLIKLSDPIPDAEIGKPRLVITVKGYGLKKKTKNTTFLDILGLRKTKLLKESTKCTFVSNEGGTYCELKMIMSPASVVKLIRRIADTPIDRATLEKIKKVVEGKRK